MSSEDVYDVWITLGSAAVTLFFGCLSFFWWHKTEPSKGAKKFFVVVATLVALSGLGCACDTRGEYFDIIARSIGLGICIGTVVSLFGTFIMGFYLVSRRNDAGETWDETQARRQEAYSQEQVILARQRRNAQSENLNINNLGPTLGYGQQPSNNPAFRIGESVTGYVISSLPPHNLNRSSSISDPTPSYQEVVSDDDDNDGTKLPQDSTEPPMYSDVVATPSPTMPTAPPLETSSHM